MTERATYLQLAEQCENRAEIYAADHRPDSADAVADRILGAYYRRRARETRVGLIEGEETDGRQRA